MASVFTSLPLLVVVPNHPILADGLHACILLHVVCHVHVAMLTDL